MKQAPYPHRLSGANLAIFSLIILTVLIFQIKNHAFTAELTGDDASHYISGLMIHDYVVSGFVLTPLNYVSMYYSHYPLIGIGHWGPFFYFLEAAWMLIVSPRIESVILLSTLITAAAAFVTYTYGTRKLLMHPAFALAAGLMFVITPLIQSGSAAIMLDLPIALLVMVATLLYTTYLETEEPLYSALFGLTAAAAILTKGNGALLAVVPPLTLITTGKWRLLKRPSFWAPAPIVAASAAPWYLLTYHQVADGFRYKWGLAYSTVATHENAKIILANLGLPLLALLVVGVIAGLRASTSPRALASRVLLAVLLSVWIFQTVAPAAIQDRYLSPLVPAAMLFAALGAEVTVAFLGSGRGRAGVRAAASGFLLALALPAALATTPRKVVGVREMAGLIWAAAPPSNRVILIAAPGEGAAIAELAMADPHRPSLFVVRGSRLLGGGGYNNEDYVPKFTNATDVREELDRTRIPLVLCQADANGWRHIAQVDEVRAAAHPAWRLIGLSSARADPFRLYALPQAAGKTADVAMWFATTAPRHLTRLQPR
jgi:hypothetical protein